MNLEEFKRKMSTGEIALGSALKMRNENAQNKTRAKMYKRIERKQGKMSKLLIPKEIALDFDPRTGDETDEFNADNKFRPVASVTTLALAIKSMASTVPATKERIMQRSGLSSWDLSDLEHITDEDKIAFAPYIYPQIFTLPTINVKLKGISQNAWGRDFIVRVNRDPITGHVVGDAPTLIQANYLYSAMAREEVAVLEESVKNGTVTLTDEQLAEKKRSIYSGRVHVSSDRASNYIRCVEIPLDPATCDITSDVKLSCTTPEMVHNMMCLSRFTTELQTTIDKLKNGVWKKYDKYLDFYEVDMVCPADKTDKKEIGMYTRYEKPDTALDTLNGYNEFVKAYIDYVDSENELETIVWTSTGLREFSEDDERRVLACMESDIDVESPYLTKNIILANKDIIMRVFGEKGDLMVVAAEGGFSEKADGVSDPSTAQDEAKKYDLSDMVEYDGLEMPEIK